MGLRDAYGLPRRTPPTIRFMVFMVIFVIVAVLGWLTLPDSAVSVALLALAALAVVFTGVFWIFSSRQVTEPPGRDPVPDDRTDAPVSRR
ncbi:MAG: hypothetical protein M3296_00010 [Actinomycetota bacterium]|nr:hypothetical protein [Actinomycetota bacterium]